MFWHISLKLGIYIQWVVSHVKFEFHSNRDTLTNFTAKNRSKSFICIHGLKNCIEASDLAHTLKYSECHAPYCFCHAWAMFGPLVDKKNTPKGELVELPASNTWGLSFIKIRSLPLKSFPDFFLNVLPYQLESWFMQWVGCTTYWVHVSREWDPCDIFHVLSLVTVYLQGIHWCWQRAY